MGKQIQKICYVNPGINIRRPISFITRYLKKKGHHISILTPKKKKDVKREDTRHYDNFEGINLITYPIWTKSSGFIWPLPTNLDFFRKCWKILKENDIIHVWTPFYPNTFITCFLKLLFFKKKTLILTMDTFPSYSFKTSSLLDVLFKIFFKTVGKITFYASNKVVIYGKSFLKYAMMVGVPQEKIQITPTGIDLTKKPPDKNIRELFKISKNEKIILFVGLINTRKGIDLIINTANLLKEENFKFLLVGDGPERKKSIDLVRNLKLQDKIVLLGNRLDVHNFYTQADLFFLPSRGEGLAGVLMEAMIYQVPIVTSGIPGTKDLINNLENGLLCETENYRCYAKSIIRLLKDTNLQQKFKQKGLERIKTNFLWENNIKIFERLYDKYSR